MAVTLTAPSMAHSGSSSEPVAPVQAAAEAVEKRAAEATVAKMAVNFIIAVLYGEDIEMRMQFDTMEEDVSVYAIDADAGDGNADKEVSEERGKRVYMSEQPSPDIDFTRSDKAEHGAGRTVKSSRSRGLLAVLRARYQL